MSDGLRRPQVRVLGLLVEALGDELLVFDSERHRAHSLNPTAARVWQACDGQRDLSALQAHCALDRDTLELALDRLRASHLLEEPPGPGPDRVSRRVMLRRSAIASAGIGVAVPIIRSIVAPSAAMAASSTCITEGNSGCGPSTSSQCCPSAHCTASHVCASTCQGPSASCSSDLRCCLSLSCRPIINSTASICEFGLA